MCSATLRLWWAGVAVALGAIALPAQELRGWLRIADGVPSPPGVIVEARTASTGLRVASALTDDRGYFVLRVPEPDSIVVHGLRIGYRPSLIGRFALGPGDVRTITATLDGAAVLLERVDIVARSVCGRAAAQGREVVAVLDEARKALRSTQLSSDGGRLVATWRTSSQLVSIRGPAITSPAYRTEQATTDRPFVSVPAEALAAAGYLRIRDGEYVYAAPDAEVLLSDAFVSGHCFRLEPWGRDGRDRVGLGFRPAQLVRGIVGIEGTLWLDRRSAELQQLEFRYVNLPPELHGAPAGGEVEFRRLRTGAFIVHRWTIRMPRPTILVEPTYRLGRQTGTVRTMRLESMEVAGGEVLEVRAGALLLLASGGAADPEAQAGPSFAVAAACGGPPTPNEGALWGVLRDTTGAARAGVAVQVEYPTEFRWSPSDRIVHQRRRVAVTTGSDGTWYLCRVPRATPLDVGIGDAAASTVWLDPREAVVRVDLSPDAPGMTERPGAVVRGVAFDSLRANAPWSGATIVVRGTSLQATTDAAGQFSIGPLPPGRHDVAAWDAASPGYGAGLAAASITVGDGGAPAEVSLATPSLPTRFREACGRAPQPTEALLLGEVRTLQGLRAHGVTVRAEWSRADVARGETQFETFALSARTDSAGRYVLCGVPADGEVHKTGDVASYASGTITLRADGPASGSGAVELHLGGRRIARRDLIVSQASERARLGGRVIDALGKPIAGATVVVGGVAGRSARTDSTGRWLLDSVPVHSTQVAVRALTYAPFSANLEPTGGRFAPLDVRLSPAPQLLGAVTVTGRMGELGYRQAFDERRRGYAFGTFLDDDVLARQNVVTPQFVIRHIPKARHFIGNQQDSDDPKVLIGRSKIGFEVDRGGAVGAMSLCFPRWFVDGVDFGVPQAEEEELWLRQAKRLEVYKASLAPPQFNDFNGCGVILIWTR